MTLRRPSTNLQSPLDKTYRGRYSEGMSSNEPRTPRSATEIGDDLERILDAADAGRLTRDEVLGLLADLDRDALDYAD